MRSFEKVVSKIAKSLVAKLNFFEKRKLVFLDVVDIKKTNHYIVYSDVLDLDSYSIYTLILRITKNFKHVEYMNTSELERKVRNGVEEMNRMVKKPLLVYLGLVDIQVAENHATALADILNLDRGQIYTERAKIYKNFIIFG